MSTWLKLLPLELKDINESDIIEPEVALEKGDQQVGIMPDMAKRLFTLGRYLEKTAKQCQLDAHYCNNKTDKLEMEAKATELGTKTNIVREIMWAGLKDEFGLWNESSIGLRTGFTVVVCSDTESDIPPIIRRLLGM